MSCLLIVDVQNDFCPGGALAVNEGDRIVPLINRLRPLFDLRALTQDWHPQNHVSFAENHEGKRPGDVITVRGQKQVLWPSHCVRGSVGAQLHPDLVVDPKDMFFKKGTDPGIDSYSAFYDNAHLKSTGLAEQLRNIGVREITLCGLALDYCVKFSALDAIAADFKVNVVLEACRGVCLDPADCDKAVEEMRRAGAHFLELTAAGGLKKTSV